MTADPETTEVTLKLPNALRQWAEKARNPLSFASLEQFLLCLIETGRQEWLKEDARLEKARDQSSQDPQLQELQREQENTYQDWKAKINSTNYAARLGKLHSP